jgi:hypothetical protein
MRVTACYDSLKLATHVVQPVECRISGVMSMNLLLLGYASNT